MKPLTQVPGKSKIAAFSLIESVAALMLVSLILLFAYQSLSLYAKNRQSVHILQRLLQSEFTLKQSHLNPINLHTKELGSVEFLEAKEENDFFTLFLLTPKNAEYQKFFKDETSF